VYLQFLKLSLDPKLNWLRILVDLAVSVTSLVYAFLGKPRFWLRLLLIGIGVFTMYSGMRRFVLRKRISKNAKATEEIIEYALDFGGYDYSKRAKEVFFPKQQSKGK
jgi:hypothetical protein